MSELTDKWRNLRRDMGNLISAVDGKIEKIDAEEKRMKNKRDESYLKGIEDMRKAVNMLYDASAVGLSSQKMEELFGTVYIQSILSRFSAIYIIDALKLFLEEKQEEFKPGDEIVIVDPSIRSNGEKRIVTTVGVNGLHLIDPATFNVTWIEKEHAKKTGKHYDAIPFLKDKEEEKEKLKEPEFKVGDEVGPTNPRIGNNEKYIIIKAEPDSNTLWLINTKTFMIRWMAKDDANYKKTGRHFDTIDIPEGGATI